MLFSIFKKSWGGVIIFVSWYSVFFFVLLKYLIINAKAIFSWVVSDRMVKQVAQRGGRVSTWLDRVLRNLP